MMQIAEKQDLLLTKLTVPGLSATRVLRKRLLERLDAGLQQPLTLISAPAGFGKTTLGIEWVEVLKAKMENEDRLDDRAVNGTAWVALDPGDNDPLRFWRYIIAAIQSVDPEVGGESLSVLGASQQIDHVSVLTPLINDLAWRTGILVLVLEDYHVIKNDQIHTALTFLIDHLPAGLHLVLLTRSDPPLPLARLRARNAVCELRAPELRFSEAETQALLEREVEPPIPADTARRLAVRTEGWPAGLRVAVLGLKSRPGLEDREQYLETFTGSQRPIMDFIVEDVLSSQSPQIQEFLLTTSILSRLTGLLCDAVTGLRESDQLLAHLVGANLFLEPLDGAGEWYRFHSLFADAMRYAARQRFGEQHVRHLALRASQWYEDHSMFSDAVESAIDAGDFGRVAALLERIIAPRLVGNEYHNLIRWMQHLPDDVLLLHPRLCLAYSQALLFTSKTMDVIPAERIHHLLDMAEHVWQKTNEPVPLAELQAFRALFAWWQGDHHRAFAHARQALDSLPKYDGQVTGDIGVNDAEWRSLSLIFVGWDEYYAGRVNTAFQLLTEARMLYQKSGNSYGMLDSLQGLAEIMIHRGEPAHAFDLYQQAQREIELSPIDHFDRIQRQGRGFSGMAAIAYERNDLDTAWQYASQALSMGQEQKIEELQCQASWVLARVERARGELDHAMRRMNSLAAQVRTPLLLRQIQGWQTLLSISAGDLRSVKRWSAEQRLPGERLPRIHQEQEALILARANLFQGRAEEALPGLEHWLEDSQAHGRVRRELEIYVLIALAHKASGRLSLAARSLAAALTLKSPADFLRIYLDEGQPLLDLLNEIASGKPDTPAYARARDILHSMRKDPSDPSWSVRPAFSPAGEPLSEQEKRVLGLLAVGYSNPEIAQEMVLSVNTIKTHVKSIYRKLNVNSRRAAREAARRTRLLS